MAPRPSAVIGLRDAQTGDARAARIRQLATPSWLSTSHPTARCARSRCSRDRCENSVINLELATAAGSSRFLACAPCWSRHDAGRFAASDSAKTARALLLWTRMKVKGVGAEILARGCPGFGLGRPQADVVAVERGPWLRVKWPGSVGRWWVV